MNNQRLAGKHGIFLLILISSLALLLILYGGLLWDLVVRLFRFLSDKEKTTAYIASFGFGAPVVFISIQILQVLIAPVPGEATGFIGGYIFGMLWGFIYSSIALTIGSIINFSIGRFLGKRYVRKLIPTKYLNKFDAIVKREGALILFILFVFPGFPKDYLCLFLGFSALPIKIFVFMAAIGRMPGTFILSLQGAMLSEQNYSFLAVATGVCVLFVLLGYRFREHFYKWIEKQNSRNPLVDDFEN